MLNEQQLSRLMDTLNVPPIGREMIERIRTSNPSRNVEGRAGNVACRFASRKMRCVIQAESHKNELAAIYLWESDGEPGVQTIWKGLRKIRIAAEAFRAADASYR